MLHAINWPYLLFQSTHPVRGATTAAKNIKPEELQFQSTHPVRGATPTRTTPG